MSTATPRPPKHPPSWFVHTAWRAHRTLYRLSGGRFLWTTSNKRGWGALRLTTIGRKSGQERSVIIGYLEDGPNRLYALERGERDSVPRRNFGNGGCAARESKSLTHCLPECASLIRYGTPSPARTSRSIQSNDTSRSFILHG